MKYYIRAAQKPYNIEVKILHWIESGTVRMSGSYIKIQSLVWYLAVGAGLLACCLVALWCGKQPADVPQDDHVIHRDDQPEFEVIRSREHPTRLLLVPGPKKNSISDLSEVLERLYKAAEAFDRVDDLIEDRREWLKSQQDQS